MQIFCFQLFEGMKAYRGVDGKIRVFRPEMNMNRMNLSARRSGLPTFEGDELIKCLSQLISIDQEWVPHSESSSLYIRPTLIGIDVSKFFDKKKNVCKVYNFLVLDLYIQPTLGVASSDSALLYTILSPVGAYFDKAKGAQTGGVSLLADPRYTR